MAFERRDHGYFARGLGYQVGLSDRGVHILGPDSAIELGFAGGTLSALTAGAPLPGRVNYLRGSDPKKWRLSVPTYDRVTYHEVYPGIDAVFYGNQSQLEFDLVIGPGADAAKVRLRLSGAGKLKLDEGGVSSESGFRLPRPTVYQGSRIIPCSFELFADGIGLQLGVYDRRKPLVVDPTIVYAGLVGGGLDDSYAQAVAVDSQGNAYIAGGTYAPDFPVQGAPIARLRGDEDGFILKINPAGTAILYSTFIGGSQQDDFLGIAVDSSGSAMVVGSSLSTDFPTLNAYQAGIAGGGSAVVVKLNPSGGLVYSTYLGNSAGGSGIAADAQGNAYVAGVIAAGGSLSTTSGAAVPAHASDDAFAAKFTAAGGLLYATYVGGAGSDFGRAIAVDGNGNAYLVGSTSSSSFTAAPAGGAQTVNHAFPYQTAFIAKLNSAGTAFSYFSFIGGSSFEAGFGAAVDANGNAYAAGFTQSADFPVTAGVAQTALRGTSNGFVVKLNAAGSSFLYATYIGGNRSDFVRGLAVDSSGNAYVTGSTNSDAFPSVAAVQSSYPGNGTSAFVTSNAAQWAAFDANIPGVVRSISPDPTASNILVASTDAATYRTTNRGATWTRSTFDSSLNLARSPANANLIYGVSCGYVDRSTDGGSHFSTAGNIPVCADTIVPDPVSANTAYAFDANTTLNPGPYKTTDGGTTWALMNSGLPASAYLFSVVAGSNGTLYADVDGFGVYKSIDQAATWTSTGNLGTSRALYGGLAIAPGSPLVLYKSTNSTVVRKSTDGGAAFLAVGGALPFSFAGLTVSATNASMVYAYSSNPAALYVSTDGGNNWSPIETGLGAAAPSRVTVDPTNSSGAFLTASVSETAFLAKINPAGTGFVYSTFFGGISDAVGYGVATFGGDAFVAGDSLGSMPVTTPIFGGTTSAYAGLVVRVTDATAGCSYSVTPASQVTYGALDARTYTVVAPSGCSWSATSDQPWATILRGATSAGTGALFVQAQPNNTGTARTANLSVGGQIVTLVQSASSCTYYLSPPSATVGAGGGSVQMTVTAPPGCPWSVANSYPLTVSVVSGASGVGNGQVTLNVGPPASTNGATYNVSIAGLAFPITQSGSCLSVGAMNLSIGAAASSGSIAVTTSGNCPWTAVSDASWLTITAGASGSAGGSVTYSAAGDTGAARSATITIGPVVVTVNQAGVIAAGAPVVGDPSPAFGSGLQQTFTFNLSDPRGYQDLDVVNVLINNFLDGRRACYLAYSVSQSALYLVDDAGDAGGPFAAGLQNSQCSVVLVSAVGNGTSLALTLKITFAGAFGGNRILYSAARDLEGGNSGWQAMGVWQVPYTPTGGIVVSGVSPARGSGLAGTATGYTIQLTDAKGTADIGVLNLLVNNAIDGRAACYLAYSATSNAIFLVDDSGDAGGPFVGSLALNGQGVIQNSQCVVNGAGTSVAANGNTLTVNLNLSFKGTFAGNRILYAAGRDHQDGNNTDWQPLATWSVQ